MKNKIKKCLLLFATCLLTASLCAQTTVTWTPSAADVTALTNKDIHYVDVGSGTKSFRVYSIRPFFNTNQVKLGWDASVNAVKMTDNGIDKSGLAIYIPENSDDIQQITVYMHTTNSRKTYYANGATCPSSGTSTAAALAQTPTEYKFWNAPFNKNWYYAFGGRNGGSGDSYYDKIEVVFAGPSGPSSDATLKSLKYNGTSVPNFDPNTTTYDVELPAGTTTVPTVTAEKNDTKATDPVINPAISLPGATTVTVTAEDGTTKKTYTINFTVADGTPVVQDVTWTNQVGKAVIVSHPTSVTDNGQITGQVKNGTSLTAIAPNFTGKNIVSWTPNTPQDFSNQPVLYTISGQGPVRSYYLTITEADPMSSDATLSSLTYGGQSVPNFSPNTLSYTIELTAGIKTPPTIGATPNDSHATMNITQAPSVPGVGKVEVTAEDGTTHLVYTINYTVKVPTSTLTLHVPEIYEAKEIAGGYDGTLSVHNAREYEVYYGSYMDGDALSITVTPGQKQAGITTSISKTSFKAADGWFEGKAVGGKSNYTFTNLDEFKAGSGALHKLGNGDEYVFHIQGYDQFSLMGKDNNADPSKGRHLEVYVDNILQTMSLSTSHTIRRFDISTGEHIIKVKAIHDGDSKSEISGFSLRVSQEPRTKWLKGNDSTQTVMQTTAIQPVVYTTKYNNILGAETRLLWLGSEATGISLTKKAGSISDTLTLGGIANCPTGEYNYAVVAYYNGAEKNRVLGKFYVKSDIKSVTSTNATVYQNEEMDQIEFKYYALSAENVILTWTGTTPAGITGNGNNGTYLIGGTPTQTGEYSYSITVQGADTTITGKITVRELDYGTNPVLYLYKNENAYESDGVRNYLKNNGWNPIERKAKKDGLRPDDQYAVYKLVVISEDVDANNPEVQRIIQENGAKQPVLNLKGFTYAKGEGLLGWGDPSNGAIDSTKNSKTKGTKIKIQHADHPIFKNISNIKEGDEIAILSNYALQGVMPIAIDMQYITDQTLCMGTAPIRKNTLNGYYDEGEWVAAIHEILPSARGGKKYICLPLARNVTLTTTGERLIKGIVDYLVNPTPTTITAPDLLITGFSVKDSKNNEYAATIDQTEHTITLKLTPEEYQALDSLKEAKPIITHPDYTSVDPASGEEVKLTYAYLRPQKYIITDFINKNVYDFILELYNPQQGIEEVYEAGQWVNIYDIYGRKVATTNEDIYTMELPHGMYIIVTESGKTIKIMK